MNMNEYLEIVRMESQRLELLTASIGMDNFDLRALQESRRMLSNNIKSAMTEFTNDINNYDGFWIRTRDIDPITGKKLPFKVEHFMGSRKEAENLIRGRLKEDVRIMRSLSKEWNANISASKKLGINVKVEKMPKATRLMKVPNEKMRGQISGVFSEYPETWGKGEWTAKTLDEAREMAVDFARGVS